MPEPGTATRALLAIARDGADERGLARQICTVCVEGLDVDGAAMSLLTATPARETLWATDPVAELLEDLQFTLNEGACMEAAATGLVVMVPDILDTTRTSRWPVFAAAVAEQSAVRALFALPLRWGAVDVGVLDLYRLRPGELDRAQQRDAMSAAETASLLILGQRTDPGGGDNWLDHALSGRAEVHQATGMVLAQLGISATDALARLRAHAFVHRMLLIDVAREVVARRLVFTEDMTWTDGVVTERRGSVMSRPDREQVLSRAFVSLADTLVDDTTTSSTSSTGWSGTASSCSRPTPPGSCSVTPATPCARSRRRARTHRSWSCCRSGPTRGPAWTPTGPWRRCGYRI